MLIQKMVTMETQVETVVQQMEEVGQDKEAMVQQMVIMEL